MADDVIYQNEQYATPPIDLGVRTTTSTETGHDGKQIQHVKIDTGDGTNTQPVSAAQSGTWLNQIVTGSTVATVEARKQTPTGNALNVQIGPGDVISNIPVVIDYDHHQLHEGETFRWSFRTLTFTKNTNKDVRLVVPSIVGVIDTPTAVQRCPHFRFESVYGATGSVTLYEGTTFTGNGTQRTPIPLERNGAYTPKLQVWEDPTVNAIGSIIWQGILIATKGSTSAADSSSNEFVLKNNTSYCLRFTSDATDNVPLLIRMIWYEDLGV